jgi:hypothetical protein
MDFLREENNGTEDEGLLALQSLQNRLYLYREVIMAQDSKSHRTRKNGASREEWQKRKAERNAKQREVRQGYLRAAILATTEAS